MSRSTRASLATRALRLLVAFAFVLVSGVVGLGGSASPAHAASGSSAVTKSGTGRFANLDVTVSATTNLINQVVSVTWTGGAPTKPAAFGYYANYVSIMQCWGDQATSVGPDRAQCQYGASGGITGDNLAGSEVGSRRVQASVTDPHETTTKAAGCTSTYVPFRPVDGSGDETCGSSAFFDRNTTNEIPLGRTRADGKGKEFFEIQTATEAAGLGCGARQTATDGSVTGRKCWLVVVPRDTVEVDGTKVSGDNDTNKLQTSPLSQSNWDQRIVFPLTFQPIGSVCAIGGSETPTSGSELATEAMSRWQTKLCNASTVVGFSQVSVDAARRTLVSSSPGLVYMSYPLDPSTLSPTVAPVYAPVALSGLSIAFNVEKHFDDSAPDSLLQTQGERFPELRLTPRLVAKLLTQTYQAGTDVTASYLKQNAADLSRDPEFLKYNPTWTHLSGNIVLPDLITPFGLSDEAKVMWTYVMSDKTARDFINGKPDPWGTTVNPNYKKLALPVEEFPKNDLYCAPRKAPVPPLCTLDAHPYAADLHDVARATARGDSLRRTNYDAYANPPSYKKLPVQSPGQRQVIGVTDTATAARYSLPTAKLENAAGKFVGPDDASLIAGYQAMTPDSVKGVLNPNPGSKNPNAYPLTVLTYGATNPAALSKADRARYADVLRYAVGPGQTPGLEPGQLPAGYAPLPTALRKQTLTTASAIENWKPAPASTQTPAPQTTSNPQTPINTTPTVTTASSGGSSTADPLTSSGATPGIDGATPVQLSAAASKTPGIPAGAARYAVLAALVLGVMAAASGPVLLTIGRRR